jgi:hypothetical protein
MTRFNILVGKHVDVHYRASDIQLSATGTLVQDSGKSIFLEERFSQGGTMKTLRLEIPYPCIARISEHSDDPDAPATSSSTQSPAPRPSQRTDF